APGVRDRTTRPGEGIAGRAFADRAPVWVRDLGAEFPEYRDTRTADVIQAARRGGVLAVPIVTGDTAWGVLAASCSTPHEFTPEEVRLLMAFAQRASIAIDKQQLLDEAEARQREATQLYEVTARLAARLDLDDVLGMIVEQARALLACDAAVVYGIDDAGERLTAMRGLNVDAALRTTLSLRIGEGPAGRAFAERG